MRKVFVALVAVLILCSLVACADGGEASSDPASVNSEPVSVGESVDVTATTVTTTESTESTTTEEESAMTTSASRTRTTVATTVSTESTTTTKSIVIANEKPVTYNTAILYNEKHSSYDAEAEKLRLSIVNTKSEIGPSEVGKTYYVSPKGDDNNDGLSPAKAWRTLANLQSPSRFGVGDVILFERGGVYRGTVYMASWVSYGAYGSGPKPAIYGSERNYADPALWEKTKTQHVWKLNVGIDTPDVGNVVFDHGKVCASVGKQLRNVLRDEFQFYHDKETGYVYLYLSKGNPGELYDDIEVCVKRPIFARLNGAQITNVTIDNLCMKYSGSFGVVFNQTENITITNCEIGYIGGSMMNESVRYGNGIEFNSHVDGALIKNNWIYQCFDAGYTNQGRGASHNNIHVTGNLVEYCNYNFEIFCGKPQEDGTYTGLMTNCVFENNVLRFAGYGFGTKNRIGSNDSVASNICYWYSFEPSKDTVIRGNVLDTAYRYLLVAAYVNDQHELAPRVEGNTWIQDGAEDTAIALQVDTAVHGWNAFAEHVLSSDGLAAMTASVNVIDKNPKKISFED